MDKKILIAGYGNIGKLEAGVYSKKYTTYAYDKFKWVDQEFQCPVVMDVVKSKYESLMRSVLSYYNEELVKEHYDFCIVCVDTPLNKETGLNDISEVEEVVASVNADIFIIRSTVPVGTCDMLMEKYNKSVIMSPEFYGTTQHSNNFEFEFTILGGRESDCYKCQQMYQQLFDARHVFRVVDAKTAEICKFMENCFLAMKVSFCGEFWKICQQEGVNYEELRECFILDPRIGPAHTFINDEQPYWKSHCFDKDIPSITNQYDLKIMKAVIDFNEDMKNEQERSN